MVLKMIKTGRFGALFKSFKPFQLNEFSKRYVAHNTECVPVYHSANCFKTRAAATVYII